MKILLAVDDSDVCAKVARRLSKMSKQFKQAPTVHLLHVVPQLSKAAEKEFGKTGPGRYYEKQAEAALSQLRPVLDTLGLDYDAGYVIGDPAPSIIAEAKAQKVDMIAMGSHGKGALKSLLIGSVAQKVVATSPVPVLLVR